MHQHSATILAGALDGFGPWLYAILFSLCPLLAVAWVLRGHGRSKIRGLIRLEVLVLKPQ